MALFILFALIVEIWYFLSRGFKSGYGLDIMEMIQFFSKPLFVNEAIVTFIFSGLILKEVYNLKKERKSNHKYLLYQKAYLKRLKAKKGSFFKNYMKIRVQWKL